MKYTEKNILDILKYLLDRGSEEKRDLAKNWMSTLIPKPREQGH